MEMDSKITFLGEGADTKISESYRSSIKHDTTNTYSYDVAADVTLKCTAPEGTSGVGLWQWVVESADRLSKTFTLHSICRYGSNYTQSPECPWNACLNGDCSECSPDWEA